MTRKPHRPEGASAWMGNATQSITNRVLSSAAYQTCVALTIARAAEIILDAVRGLPDEQHVVALRKLGGITGVIARTLEQVIAETPGTTEQMGSKLFPLTPAEELRRDARMWSGEVQVRVADALLKTKLEVTP